jgi:hypothetical protein
MNAPAFVSRRIARAALVACAGLALGACCSDPVRVQDETPAVCRAPATTTAPIAAADPLFVLLDAPALTEDQARRLVLARATRTAAEVHVARLAENAGSLLQPGRQMIFNVSPTRMFSVEGLKADTGASYVSFHGRLNGELGEVTLVRNGEGITGGLQSVSTQETYEFHPIGGGLHAVTCVDPTRFGPD